MSRQYFFTLKLFVTLLQNFHPHHPEKNREKIPFPIYSWGEGAALHMLLKCLLPQKIATV